MLLSYNELCGLIEQGVIDAPFEHVNSSSIDLTLADAVMIESRPRFGDECVDITNKQTIWMFEKRLSIGGYDLDPGEFVLASSRETFNLPNTISAEYKLKSTMARNGLEHLNAGWCDAGWNRSKLTLELKNMTRFHSLILRPGMKIGQIVFFKHAPVPEDKSYAARGQYNGQDGVTAGRGMR